MQLHLDEIATKIAPSTHTNFIPDQAGCHGGRELSVWPAVT
jgi:hypothetical protein